MRHRGPIAAFLALALGLAGAGACAQDAPSAPAVDAPQLAALGPWSVGVHSQVFTQPRQADPLSYDPATHAMKMGDRVLPVDIWYPAHPTPGARPETYAGALSGEDGKDVAFSTPGIAVREAAPAEGAFPLVILAHGYGGTPAAMTWLAENLASKGYVVVGPHFRDPAYGDSAGFIGPLVRRPMDMAFVAAEAQARARARQGVLAAADPRRTILIGYSMGGYAALTAAGAPLAPELGPRSHDILTPYVAGAPDTGQLKVADVAAVVAIAPFGLTDKGEVWGGAGLGAITAPTLIVAGSQDRTVGYDHAAKAFFAEETHAPRYLLTFLEGGHSIGMNPAPPTMRGRLWDLDWWEDPVWRKDRVIGVQLHVITAFLAAYAKGDAGARAYLDAPAPASNDGAWTPKPDAPYAAFSPGAPAASLWKGFQRAHASGLDLRFLPAQ